jgi:hypothetical protein
MPVTKASFSRSGTYTRTQHLRKVNNFDLGEDKRARRWRSVLVGRHNRRWFRSTNPAMMRTIMTQTVVSMFEDIFCIKVLLLVSFYFTWHENIKRTVGKLRVKFVPYRTRHKVIITVNSYRSNIFNNLHRIHLRHLCRIANVLEQLFTNIPSVYFVKTTHSLTPQGPPK